MGTRLHCCVCHATLQFSNGDPKLPTKYVRSRLILPRGVQYNDRLYPTILEPRNHCGPLIDPATREPCPMEVVGDFRAVDPIFKGCYGGSLLYSKDDLALLRQWKSYLPTFQGEIPVPSAPSYQQVREPAATKQSPHRVAAPDTSVESPKAKCSSSKSGPPRGSRHSSNTSTLKCLDSTSTKKPSCPKESTPDEQVKSPQAHSSCKHACSPSPASGSAGCKQRDLHGVDSSTVDTTLPIGSSILDTFCSPTGSFSNIIEPLPPSITSTPLGQASPRHGQMTSSDSRHSSASLFTGLSFNLCGYPAVGLGSLTPSVPSIAGSHHVLGTWPHNLFPSRPSTLRLTIDIFGLASKCQALGIRLAKDFQVLSGLEAIHRNSIQGIAHEMLTLGHSAQEAAYTAILQDNITEAEHEAMTGCLCSKADAAWKKMHEVMYNHQLEYDWRLANFLKEAEMMLANMRDQIWTAVCALTESEGMTFEDCRSLMLCILLLLLQILVDVLFQMQIPLTIAYCPESSVYRRWHSKQGGVSPLHKEVRASWTLTKVLGGVTHQGSEGMDHLPSPAISKGSVGSGGLQSSRARSCSCARSITSHRSWQSGSAQSQVTDDGQETSSESEPSHDEEDVPREDEDAEVGKGDIKVLSNGQVASDGDKGQGRTPIQNTLTGVSSVFSTHEETDADSDNEEKIQSAQQKRCQPSPKEDMPSKDLGESSSKEEQPSDKALHNKAWQRAQQLDTNFDAWRCKKIAKGVAGWDTRDTMICDLTKHGKAQPNHPDPAGPPLDYMHKR